MHARDITLQRERLRHEQVRELAVRRELERKPKKDHKQGRPGNQKANCHVPTLNSHWGRGGAQLDAQARWTPGCVHEVPPECHCVSACSFIDTGPSWLLPPGPG